MALTDAPTALERLAARLEPRLHRSFLQAVKASQDAIDLQGLAAAIEEGVVSAAEAATQLDLMAAAWAPSVRQVIQGAFVAGATSALDGLTARFGTTFEAPFPDAVAYAATRSATLVREVTDSTRQAIRAQVAAGIEAGEAPRTTAKRLRDVIGLREDQVAAVNKFRDGLLVRDVEGVEAELRATRYAEAKIRERAEMIARTETMDSLNEGRQALWDRATEAGLLQPDRTSRVWNTAIDERTCPECEELDGVEVAYDEDFELGDPPIHPDCRCTIELAFTEGAEKAVVARVRKYAEDQERDDHGRWSSGAGTTRETPAPAEILARLTRGSGLTAAPLSTADRETLSAWLETQPTTEFPVYRGLWMSDNQWQTFMESHSSNFTDTPAPIPLRGLESFTADPIRSSAYGTGGDVFVDYVLPPGHAVDISAHSVYPEEQEALLPRAATFAIDRIEAPRGPGTGYYRIHLGAKVSGAEKTVTKYSEDQPRVPAGSPEGGEWSGGEGGGGTPPIRAWVAPPAPTGAGRGEAGGLSATGVDNTTIGRIAERAMQRFDLQDMHPGTTQGRLDRKFNGSDWAFEVKCCQVEAQEYKIKMKGSELREKQAFARQNGLKAGSMIVVLDTGAGKAHAYWRETLGNFRLNPANPGSWHYMGTARVPKGGRGGSKSIESESP